VRNARMLRVMVTVCLLATATAPGQQQITENTVRLAEGAASPPATLSGMAWLAGSWTGDALRGQVEEIWSPPQAGAMMGMFRLLREGKTVFYELMTRVEENGSLVLRVKHFNPDLTGWEDKSASVDFALVAVDGDRFLFDGLTFHRQRDDTMTIHVVISAKDGAIREEVFRYARVKTERPLAE